MAAFGAPEIGDDEELALRGVVRVDLSASVDLDWDYWASYAKAVSPLVAAQDDGGQPHFNDLLDAPRSFPFGAIMAAVAPVVDRCFIRDPAAALQVYDAFTLHYDAAQAETKFSKHRDPSFLTLNLCLARDPETRGSQIEFWGAPDAAGDPEARDRRFLAATRERTVLIHQGRHLHQTRPLQAGSRSQALLYYTRNNRPHDNDGMCFGYVDD